MSGKEVVVTWIVGVASAALPAFSQSENPEKNVVSVQAFGSFTAIITAVKPTTAIRSTRRATARPAECKA
jgi:hypothetical protein